MCKYYFLSSHFYVTPVCKLGHVISCAGAASSAIATTNPVTCSFGNNLFHLVPMFHVYEETLLAL